MAITKGISRQIKKGIIMSKQTAETLPEIFIWSLIGVTIFILLRAIYIELKKQ